MARFSLYLAIPAVLILSGSVRASTILDEDFDELTATLAVTSVGAFSAIDGTNVDIVGAGDGFAALCAAPESGNCVDLDGSGGLSQGILQTNTAITLDPGINYFLSFDLIGSGRGVETSSTVTFGPYTHTFDLLSGDVTTGIISDLLVTVSSPTVANLTFTSNTPGDVGAVLDNVLITSSAATTIPEPSSIMLTGLGLLGLALVGRRALAGSR